MRIAIVGATGTLGKQATARLREAGHEVRELGRHVPEYRVDVTTGEGLARALEGCEVVVDTSNATKNAAATLVDGNRRLLHAERDAGVKHHVAISIVGCDRVPMAYYRVKVAQEKVVESGGVPWTIVRATQFHEFVTGMVSAGAAVGVLPLLRAWVQPVSTIDVAEVLADVAAGEPRGARLSVAGPEILDARAVAREWRAASGRTLLPIRVPLPGAFGRALRAGGLVTEDPDRRGTRTYADWLARNVRA
jgi:uncharacterized protein YbjT (DUF2867 family)